MAFWGFLGVWLGAGMLFSLAVLQAVCTHRCWLLVPFEVTITSSHKMGLSHFVPLNIVTHWSVLDLSRTGGII